MRASLVASVFAILLLFGTTGRAQTVNERFKKLGMDHIQIEDHTRDACDRGNDITITTTTDGKVVLKPGETKFFEIKKDDQYTRSGGWVFYCGNSEERARIRGSTYIMAVRKNNGVVDWFWVTIKL